MVAEFNGSINAREQKAYYLTLIIAFTTDSVIRLKDHHHLFSQRDAKPIVTCIFKRLVPA